MTSSPWPSGSRRPTPVPGALPRGSQIALWVLTTRMAPPIAFAIPFFLAYRHLGLDTLHGLILIYLTFNLSLVIWMMRTFFDGVPRAAGGGGRSSTARAPVASSA